MSRVVVRSVSMPVLPPGQARISSSLGSCFVCHSEMHGALPVQGTGLVAPELAGQGVCRAAWPR